jgi:hypothetical protein
LKNYIKINLNRKDVAMSFEEEVEEYFSSMKFCECCNYKYTPDDLIGNYCIFCAKISKEMIFKINNKKKDEKSIDYRIRNNLFKKTKVLFELYEINAPSIVMSGAYFLVLYSYEISEYNKFTEVKINENDTIEKTFQEILLCYFENREQDLPEWYEKFKAVVMKSEYGIQVKEKMKNKIHSNQCLVEEYCLDCGERVEEYMKNGYCQACTMIDQAIGGEE